MTTRLLYKSIAAALLAALGCLAGCALNDGGIVGTGNRPECTSAERPADCPSEQKP